MVDKKSKDCSDAAGEKQSYASTEAQEKLLFQHQIFSALAQDGMHNSPPGFPAGYMDSRAMPITKQPGLLARDPRAWVLSKNVSMMLKQKSLEIEQNLSTAMANLSSRVVEKKAFLKGEQVGGGRISAQE